MKKQYEICIICKKKLKIRKDLPVDQRKYYVEGAGQLCLKCYQEIYNKNSLCR